MKSNLFKKLTAGALALALVTGNLPLKPMTELFGDCAIMDVYASSTDIYLAYGSQRPWEGVPITEGENVVYLEPSNGYWICNSNGDGWGGFGGSINVPYTGEESTFGNGGRYFWVSQSGYYVITLTDKGNDSWFISVTYSLADHCTVSEIPDQTYTGSEITPAVEVKDGETILTLDMDYTIEYSDNTEAGTAAITITGIGNYCGTIEKTFNITRKITISHSIENGTVEADKVGSDEGDTVTLTVTPDAGYAVGSVSVNDGTVAVTKNTDGTYSFTMPDGDATVNAVFVSTKLTDEEYTQKATYTDPDTGAETYYTRYVFVKAKSDIEGKSKATFTATYNGTPYTYETNTYYTGVTSNGITYTPAENSVLFVVTVSSSSDISEGLTCELKLE